MIRIVGEAQPRYVVIENVPPLLAYRGRVDTDLAELGYGTIWQVCEAADVGAPHRRQRVFVVAVRGLAGSRMLPRPSPQGDLFAPAFGGSPADGLWPTPPTGDHATMYQQGGEPLGHAARWPTPTLCGNHNRKGASATSGDGLATAAKAWPTPRARDASPEGHAAGMRRLEAYSTCGLQTAAKAWPTPVCQDARGGRGAGSIANGGGERLSNAAASCWPTPRAAHDAGAGSKGDASLHSATKGDGVLNPAWVDLLMGLPAGWTDPEADADLDDHAWPAGRGEQQRPGEPPRLVAPKSIANRGARLKALGNAVVWQQAHAAIVRALEVLS